MDNGKVLKLYFLNFPVGFWIPIIFFQFEFKLFSNVLGPIKLQKQVEKAICFKNCSNLSLFRWNVLGISNILKILRLQPEIQSFSHSLQQIFFTVGQNNFGNKIILLCGKVWKTVCIHKYAYNNNKAPQPQSKYPVLQ